MSDRRDPSRPAGAGGLLLAACGAAISWFAMVTYFLVVPRWPDLRDSGVPSVILALAGVGVGLLGLRRAFGARRMRTGSSAAFALGALAAGFLALYIFHLSYRLPPADGVVKVGEKAPAFRLRDQEGRERTLADFQGKRLLLVFFRGHW